MQSLLSLGFFFVVVMVVFRIGQALIDFLVSVFRIALYLFLLIGLLVTAFLIGC